LKKREKEWGKGKSHRTQVEKKQAEWEKREGRTEEGIKELLFKGPVARGHRKKEHKTHPRN